jgi:PRTRC genetic system protein C
MTTQPHKPNTEIIILDGQTTTEQAHSQGQSDFFNQPDASGKPAKRLFKYDGQYYEDPGLEYSVQDILNFLAQTYPELASGTWSSRTLPDGTEEITFVKVTGEKGVEVSPQVLADQLCQGTHPTRFQASETLAELLATEEAGRLNADQLLVLAPQIEAALQQAERISQQSQRMVAQCLRLKPVPWPKIPLGF